MDGISGVAAILTIAAGGIGVAVGLYFLLRWLKWECWSWRAAKTAARNEIRYDEELRGSGIVVVKKPSIIKVVRSHEFKRHLRYYRSPEAKRAERKIRHAASKWRGGHRYG